MSTDGGANFNDIAGETSNTLDVPVVAATSGHQYRAVFTNVAGSTPSSPATLTVVPGLAILASPVSHTAVLGDSVSFTASATGTTKTAIQWQMSSDGGVTFSNIAGATKTTFTVKKVLAGQDGNLYRAKFTNAAGTAVSSVAALTVNFTVTLSKKQPITVEPGTAVTLVAQSSKLAPTGYQWQKSVDKGKTWTDMSGVTAGTLVVNVVVGDNGSYFRAEVTTTKSTTKSMPAILTVSIHRSFRHRRRTCRLPLAPRQRSRPRPTARYL